MHDFNSRDDGQAPAVGHNGGPAIEPVLMTFEEVRAALRPMGLNQVYQRFREGQIPGGVRMGGRWYAIRQKFNKEYRGETA